MLSLSLATGRCSSKSSLPYRASSRPLIRSPHPFALRRAEVTTKCMFTLGKTRLIDRFDGRIFSVDQVAQGKPAPDIFLFAADQMGAAPDRCAVVEDSVSGVTAGLAAGMAVFAFAGSVTQRRRPLDGWPQWYLRT